MRWGVRRVITVDVGPLSNLKRAVASIRADVRDKALVRALNATVTQAKPAMAREITGTYRVRSSDVKERLTVSRAKAENGKWRFEASLAASTARKGRSMNLIAFVARTVTLAQARKRMKAGEGGVQTLRRGGKVQKALELEFQIKRTGGKKRVPGAFVANKGRTVFIRQGKRRLPIEPKNTIDVPQMFNAKRINSVVRDVMQQRFDINLKRELRSVLKGYV